MSDVGVGAYRLTQTPPQGMPPVGAHIAAAQPHPWAAALSPGQGRPPATSIPSLPLCSLGVGAWSMEMNGCAQPALSEQGWSGGREGREGRAIGSRGRWPYSDCPPARVPARRQDAGPAGLPAPVGGDNDAGQGSPATLRREEVTDMPDIGSAIGYWTGVTGLMASAPLIGRFLPRRDCSLGKEATAWMLGADLDRMALDPHLLELGRPDHDAGRCDRCKDYFGMSRRARAIWRRLPSTFRQSIERAVARAILHGEPLSFQNAGAAPDGVEQVTFPEGRVNYWRGKRTSTS